MLTNQPEGSYVIDVLKLFEFESALLEGLLYGGNVGTNLLPLSGSFALAVDGKYVLQLFDLLHAGRYLTAERDSTTEQNAQLTNELNLCYYAIGNKSELKENKIIETG